MIEITELASIVVVNFGKWMREQLWNLLQSKFLANEWGKISFCIEIGRKMSLLLCCIYKPPKSFKYKSIKMAIWFLYQPIIRAYNTYSWLAFAGSYTGSYIRWYLFFGYLFCGNNHDGVMVRDKELGVVAERVVEVVVRVTRD